MKKGFTMIELIFVIVILGILASVAIPRLAATRDDAEISKAAANASIAFQDIATYYTANGSFAGKVKDMTNVKLTDDGVMQVKGENCLTFQTANSTLTVTAIDTGICAKVKELPGIKKMLENSGAHNFGPKGINWDGTN